MQRFLGAANFHREFSKDYARIAAPLDECRNMKSIEWTDERKLAFENVVRLFQKDILLRHIDWSKKIYVTSDASSSGIGAWIGQIDERGELVPVICASKKLSTTQQRWPAVKRELYALMWAFKKFRT
ncbi:MAG: ribonuclease H family protein, partial [Vulcanimicrobiaceae bacterium]